MTTKTDSVRLIECAAYSSHGPTVEARSPEEVCKIAREALEGEALPEPRFEHGDGCRAFVADLSSDRAHPVPWRQWGLEFSG